MNELGVLLDLPSVRLAILALLLGSLSLPVVGVFIVGLDIMPVRFAMMHVALLGIALGFLTGLDPLLCALVLCAVTGGALTPMARSSAGLSGAMGLLMTLAIAAALMLLSVSGVNANGAFELLWGSILATRPFDVAALAVLAGVVPVLYWLRRRDLALLLHDRELALCSGVAVDRLTLILLVIISLAIASAIRLTGALLVDALTLLPALAARRVGGSLAAMIRWSLVFGLAFNVGGFFLALLFDLPPGPTLVLVGGVVTLLIHAVPTYRKGSPQSCASSSASPLSPSSH
ncbi:zinc ABC transporter permease [Acrocarpospora phusangensis]|uniref:Zinc ABC transporter permease n=1 Tax=Acrocarpospora phusangensis TaxID=1070424 RepID=A0A919UJ19_9ACTN|nr:metal ABC transporter permease [Acrocarpospora phusangensis]GIH23644.1 zinc ABC transporter permease [Acrocarpospora phusangensis]